MPESESPPWRLYPRAGNSFRAKEIVISARAQNVIVRRLSAKTIETARPNTLSSRHGLDTFPLHTDQVLANTAPRWLLLVAPRQRATKTVLFDTRSLLLKFGEEFLHRALFLQKIRAGKYVRLLSYANTKRIFKYNPDIFQPVNNEAHAVLEYIESTTDITIVDWQEHYMVLIDNWSAFHGRGPHLDPNGIGLFRFTIWSDANELDID